VLPPPNIEALNLPPAPKLPPVPRALSPRIPEAIPAPVHAVGLKPVEIKTPPTSEPFVLTLLDGKFMQLVQPMEKNLTIVVDGKLTKIKSITYNVLHTLFRCQTCGMIHNESKPQQEVCSYCA
jgi:hypothetical protein